MITEPQTYMGQLLAAQISARLQLIHCLDITTKLLRKAASGNEYSIAICDNNTELLLELERQQNETHEAFLAGTR